MRACTAILATLTLVAASAPVRAHDHAVPTQTTPPASTTNSADRPTRTADSPILEMDAMEHDFGKITPGTPLTWTFKFKNKGKTDLQITEVKPSCGCTKGDFDKVVKPGKSGKISLAIDKTEKYVGKTVKTAYVSTNDPENLFFTLTMRADFIAPAKTAAAPTE